MGMYSKLELDLLLKPDTPKEILSLLNLMLDPNLMIHTEPIRDTSPLFQTDRWRYILLGSSAYFDTNGSYLIGNHLTISCSLKNYDNEISKFISWIKPHVLNEGVVGETQYEEDVDSTLIIF